MGDSATFSSSWEVKFKTFVCSFQNFRYKRVVNAAQLAKRSFLRELLAFAAQYVVPVHVNQDSQDKDVMAAFRRVARKAHPDKGRRVQDSQELHAAKNAWDDARKGAPKARETDWDIQGTVYRFELVHRRHLLHRPLLHAQNTTWSLRKIFLRNPLPEKQKHIYTTGAKH